MIGDNIAELSKANVIAPSVSTNLNGLKSHRK
jgi:hypothetical protein